MYVDSCILVKLLVPEPDSDSCARRLAGASLICSELSSTELHSALLRKERQGEITPDSRRRSWAGFEQMLAEGSLELAPLNSSILRSSRDVLSAIHPRVSLKALDAIHLATYLSLLTGPFFTKDVRLREAAQLLEIPLAE